MISQRQKAKNMLASFRLTFVFNGAVETFDLRKKKDMYLTTNYKRTSQAATFLISSIMNNVLTLYPNCVNLKKVGIIIDQLANAGIMKRSPNCCHR